MMFRPPKKQPSFAELKKLLSQTQLDNTTYELIERLLEKLTQFQSLIVEQIEEIIKSVGTTEKKIDSVPSNPVPGLHAPTHRPGGTDPLVSNAWTDQPNVFTRGNRFGNAVTIEGNAEIPTINYGIKLTGGYNSPDAGRIIFGDGTGWKLHLGPRITGVNYDRFTFDDLGNFTAIKDITAGVFLTGNYVNSNGRILINGVTDSLYLRNSNYTRMHWQDQGQPAGAQCFTAINYQQNLGFCPTSDDGLNPVGGNWFRSLYIDRSGIVGIGVGGLYVNKVINAPGLAGGQYTPGTSGVSNVSSVIAGIASYIRVGNVVTVSGRVTITIITAGLYQFLLTVPFANVQQGAGVFQIAANGTQAGYISQNATYPNFMIFGSYAGASMIPELFYTYTYTIA